MSKSDKPANDERLQELFFHSLFGELQRSIIKKLNKEEPVKVDRLISLLEAEKSTTIKHLVAQMEEVGIVTKNNSDEYSLTSFGKACYSQILLSFEFLNNYRDYFTVGYGFGNLDLGFLNIGALSNSKLVSGHISEQWQEGIDEYHKFLKKAEKNIFIISPFPSTRFFEVLYRHASKHGIEVKYVISQDEPINTRRIRLAEKYQPDGISDLKTRHWRKASDLQVGVTITDKGACIMFPGSAGVGDAYSVFYSKDDDKDFVGFCKVHFQQTWERANI